MLSGCFRIAVHGVDDVPVSLQDDGAFHFQRRREDAVGGAPLVGEKLETFNLLSVAEESVNLLHLGGETVFHFLEIQHFLVLGELYAVFLTPCLHKREVGDDEGRGKLLVFA